MLVNVHHDSAKEHNRLLVAGVVFLSVIALLVWLSIAIYNKTFESSTKVVVKADRAGLQLAKFGDVRINGALVGRVDRIDQDGEEAEITLALQPSAAEKIPANISVQILPTTLFGQKFVSLVRPDEPSPKPIRDGDVISSDRVETNVELSQILADLFPLLRSVKPADLNATLNALATALEGRGNDLGATMDELGEYIGAIDGSLPTLRKDLEALADVAEAYDAAAPDLLDVLDNLTVTSKTVVEKAADLDVFFSDLTGLARTSTRLLGDNEQNLIRMGEVTEPVLALLAEYSPQFPCLIRGAANYEPILSKTFEGNWVKQYIELGSPQYRVFDETDLPEYGEVGHGPWCLGLPNFKVPGDPAPLDQGSDIDERGGYLPVPVPGAKNPKGVGHIDSGYAGSLAEQQVINAMLADGSGRQPGAYGALGPLLYGPVVREGRAQG
ncbi:MCE family protein [Nocardioides sp. zg-536]|uniref:MCE family protein n=1 Tax=Nocardioides faecalis TaxID=2803858 RepID=A0A939BYR7_9ACTN|nr:MCE family protein [Nocardioides faecalis]MBM9460603.1 MCE family protein [Nocardioides faecalis]MBS4754334.1 MCE family protein [Nocardioides faecalis]QVI57475.1 MCE family protein [Nocardioides faecalis]